MSVSVLLQVLFWSLATAIGSLTYFYFGGSAAWIFVSAPFAVLALLSKFSSKMTENGFLPLIGAGIGAFLAVVIPASRVAYGEFHNWPGGADLGLGLLIMAVPAMALILGGIGYHVGHHFSKRHRPDNQ